MCWSIEEVCLCRNPGLDSISLLNQNELSDLCTVKGNSRQQAGQKEKIYMSHIALRLKNFSMWTRAMAVYQCPTTVFLVVQQQLLAEMNEGVNILLVLGVSANTANMAKEYICIQVFPCTWRTQNKTSCRPVVTSQVSQVLT